MKFEFWSGIPAARAREVVGGDVTTCRRDLLAKAELANVRLR